MAESASYSLGSDFRLEELVKALNSCLPGNHLLVVSFDTSRIPHALMVPAYRDMASHEIIQVRHHVGTPASHRYLEIPISLGINVPIHPLVCNGETHVGAVEINGDHVVIKVPYFYYEENDRVDERHYSITILRPL